MFRLVSCPSCFSRITTPFLTLKRKFPDLSFCVSCHCGGPIIPWWPTYRCHHQWTEILEWWWKIRCCLHTRRRHKLQRRDRRWRHTSRLILVRWPIRSKADNLLHCWQKWVSFVLHLPPNLILVWNDCAKRMLLNNIQMVIDLFVMLCDQWKNVQPCGKIFLRVASCISTTV